MLNFGKFRWEHLGTSWTRSSGVLPNRSCNERPCTTWWLHRTIPGCQGRQDDPWTHGPRQLGAAHLSRSKRKLGAFREKRHSAGDAGACEVVTCCDLTS